MPPAPFFVRLINSIVAHLFAIANKTVEKSGQFCEKDSRISRKIAIWAKQKERPPQKERSAHFGALENFF